MENIEYRISRLETIVQSIAVFVLNPQDVDANDRNEILLTLATLLTQIQEDTKNYGK